MAVLTDLAWLFHKVMYVDGALFFAKGYEGMSEKNNKIDLT